MRFKCQVDINLPREKVIPLWNSVENLKHWQDDFENYELLSGEMGKTGSKGKMTYKRGKGKMLLEETVLENNLPELFRGRYVHEKMTNTMTNVFVVIDKNTTRWQAEIHYEKFSGFFMKLMAKLFGGKFKAQTQKWLDQFKVFAENRS